jgi:hypothetical protein
MEQTNPKSSLPPVSKAVRALNAHHSKTGAGFYASTLGGRFFLARSHDGHLEVSDFERWIIVPADKMKFHDHNGRDIPLT